MKYVTPLTDDFKFDDHIRTFDNDIYLFTTPQFKYKGVVVKRALPNSPSRKLLEKEAEILLRLKHYFIEDYKIPDVLLYHSLDFAIVTQRLYGKTALEPIIREDKGIITDIVEWISKLHQIDSNESDYEIKETESFKRFKYLLEKDDNGNPNFKKLKELLNQWSEVKSESRISILQGDLSPIHFYQENDGLYSLDFNGVKKGPIEEDIASFISNARLHIMNQTNDKNIAERQIKRFLDQYSERNNVDLKNLNFYITFFDYLKHRIKENNDELLETTIENLKI